MMNDEEFSKYQAFNKMFGELHSEFPELKKLEFNTKKSRWEITVFISGEENKTLFISFDLFKEVIDFLKNRFSPKKEKRYFLVGAMSILSIGTRHISASIESNGFPSKKMLFQYFNQQTGSTGNTEWFVNLFKEISAEEFEAFNK